MREIYEGAVKEYLQNDFGGVSGDALPFSVNIAIDKLMQADNNRPFGVSSVAGDTNETYSASTWDADILRLLRPHKKMKVEA